MKPSTLNDINPIWLDPAAPVLNATAKPDAFYYPVRRVEGTPIRRSPDWKSAAKVQAPAQPLDAVAWVEALAGFAQPVARS
ncbi:hypothetical protein [Thiocapsa marina]|uniref:Uncharacterized protein n=1 Tax=Thiocapsa marina 5811 TaxID=768671 RepID=F9UHP6_9GAMM|nr:hypothetical protein [Thiocapsa marina]EGV16222.1 hypothetical protein ThimaDRAFT_4449 [Thiocapsa marina 5811]